MKKKTCNKDDISIDQCIGLWSSKSALSIGSYNSAVTTGKLSAKLINTTFRSVK